MEWYQILSLCGIPTLVGLIVADIYARIKLDGKKHVQKRKQERIEEIQEAIKDPIQKILDDYNPKLQKIEQTQNSISNRIRIMEDSDICVLRNGLLNSYTYCEKQGFRSTDDTESWMHMYESYKALGGNSFIDRLKQDFEKLPTEAEYLNSHRKQYDESAH